MATIRFGNKSISLPGSVLFRRVLGVLLIIGGIFGFLPVIGFWMAPLGLLVLSYDSHIVRRWRRRKEVWWFGRFWPRVTGAAPRGRQRRHKK